jgi:hypothetical protein
MRGMTFEFEYLSEFECIFKNNQEEESGDQERALMKKKPEAENLVQVYL